MRKLIILLSLCLASLLMADNESCFDCHSDPDLTAERGNRTIRLFVNESVYKLSVHEGLECSDCHSDTDSEDLPHEELLQPVNCGECHDDVQEQFESSIHGYALKKKMAYAPTCRECHGKHDIMPPTSPQSTTYKMNIPKMCGSCHREGAPVAKVYNINEHNIIENYSQSIHGEGLFKKGLSVTAACVDCHNSHFILPHTNPASTISPRNIAKTCMKCHVRIEDVHDKVIVGERWKKSPESIPSCTDCHLPHKARKESMVLTLSDKSCQNCHAKKEVHKTIDDKIISLTISRDDIRSSVHNEISCVKCHSDVDPRLKRPCETARIVECAKCHISQDKDFVNSGHFKAREEGVDHAPTCTNCHGSHKILSEKNEKSPTYRANVPNLCGSCHSKGSDAIETQLLLEKDAFSDYSMSVHGQSIGKKGFLPSAICSDCHSAHLVLKQNDPTSSVSDKNIPATCSTCHKGIYEQYSNSIHFSNDEKEMQKLPSCAHCHSAHTITKVKQNDFMQEITHSCGACHEELSSSYMSTMHGKAHQLGYLKSAKCSDCHTAHNILPASHTNSSINLQNIVGTCQNCHPDANQRFTGYLTHATHHDPIKYPILYYTYWAMTLLLIGVFSFFGVHTILWLPRSFRHLRERRKNEKEAKTRYYIRRFDPIHRFTHLLVILSFLSLALTGMILKFSGLPWAHYLANLVGGVKSAGLIHRFAAIITFLYFIIHIVFLIKRKRKTKAKLSSFIFGPNSMMFNLKDLKDFWATLKWFLGFGKRPDYGRWTYWEKFDYFAVFWGVLIIGLSGLMLWFPEFFTIFFPGWLINVATIIHSDEALLAVGFIFTIHFFNTHFRPESFPMDKVIFTGLVPLEEYKKDRPQEFANLMKTGEIKKVVVKDYVPKKFERLAAFFGFIFLGIGVIIIMLIIYSLLMGYN